MAIGNRIPQEIPLYLKELHLPEYYSDAGIRFSVNFLEGTCNYISRKNNDARVYFMNDHTGIRKELVNRQGLIQDFPGIDYDPILKREYVSNREIPPEILYSASFYEFPGQRFVMLWTVQPDGRYWEDSDGFGAEDDLHISLYSVLDENGAFLQPFRLFSVDKTLYYHEDA